MPMYNSHTPCINISQCLCIKLPLEKLILELTIFPTKSCHASQSSTFKSDQPRDASCNNPPLSYMTNQKLQWISVFLKQICNTTNIFHHTNTIGLHTVITTTTNTLHRKPCCHCITIALPQHNDTTPTADEAWHKPHKTMPLEISSSTLITQIQRYQTLQSTAHNNPNPQVTTHEQPE